MKKGFVVSIIIGIIIILIFLGWLFTSSNSIEGCTEEAKLCPDGTAIGRTGPNCEFSQCPIENENNLESCNSDQECIIVNYNHCCGSTKRSINKDYLIQYNSHPEWQVFNNQSICELIGQCLQDTNVTQSKCVDSRCQLVYA